MTVGSPPSTTATTEFVVPRSMPITFAMLSISSVCVLVERYDLCQRRRGTLSPPPPVAVGSGYVDLDRPRLDLFGLGQLDREHAVPIRRLHLVGLDRNRKGEAALELAVPALAAVDALLAVRGCAALAPEGQDITRDRELHVLLGHPGQLHAHHQIVLGLEHVDCGSPDSIEASHGSTEEALEHAIHLGLQIPNLLEGIPPHDALIHRTPTHDCHCRSSFDSS